MCGSPSSLLPLQSICTRYQKIRQFSCRHPNERNKLRSWIYSSCEEKPNGTWWNSQETRLWGSYVNEAQNPATTLVWRKRRPSPIPQKAPKSRHPEKNSIHLSYKRFLTSYVWLSTLELLLEIWAAWLLCSRNTSPHPGKEYCSKKRKKNETSGPSIDPWLAAREELEWPERVKGKEEWGGIPKGNHT